MLILIGLLAGIIGGMGIGGGTILIPSLLFLTSIDQKMAQSVNLLASIPMTIFALIFHIKNKNVEYKIILPIVSFGIIGAVIGSKISSNLNSDFLRRIFGIFLFVMGVYEIKKGFHKKDTTPKK
ncbi:sulfite exporter TauE/SafE family protein [Tepidibacter hydrothermalis]|uniref:Probable membrane transporter protein n=1 Tax=Tepidibacter hydrothermalis TaxID=3036126 RepID=A0ABY8E8R9_9FIRM|nr:sulfite exporter TauE/SafE family protein [Tepidibacter hydrothermalis]WFD09296.1 sulfite exporter TauE/SafE family protein [Tepidibacter hydrothermalis]